LQGILAAGGFADDLQAWFAGESLPSNLQELGLIVDQ
jgi:hypothetical protein